MIRARCLELRTPSFQDLLSGAPRSEQLLLTELARLLSTFPRDSTAAMRLLGQTEIDVRQAMINDGWPVDVAIYSALVLTDALEGEASTLRTHRSQCRIYPAAG